LLPERDRTYQAQWNGPEQREHDTSGDVHDRSSSLVASVSLIFLVLMTLSCRERRI
jgi:hypothetical protein